MREILIKDILMDMADKLFLMEMFMKVNSIMAKDKVMEFTQEQMGSLIEGNFSMINFMAKVFTNGPMEICIKAIF